MTTRAVPFHIYEQVSIALPRLINGDGTPRDGTGASVISLVTRRDDQATSQITTLGITPGAGLTAGVLSWRSIHTGDLNLLVDTAYFSDGIPVYATVWIDGVDYPQEGFIILQPQGEKP